jgi:hypothetical protein
MKPHEEIEVSESLKRRAAAMERARIVAWLRTYPKGHNARRLATLIEDGKHDDTPITTDEVEWFAATVDIERMGPYTNAIDAWAALRRSSGEVNAPGDRVWPERKGV